MQKYEWVLAEPDLVKVNMLVKGLNISPILAKILVNRNIASLEEAKAFLDVSIERLSSPFELPDMTKAVEIILASINKKDKIAVYGDYDADGITSTYVLSFLLRKAGAEVITYIPSRMEEGYGLNYEALEKLLQDDVKLLITVDCGIAAIEEMKYARENGMECIITDHHTPPEVLPDVPAIVNPKLAPDNIATYDLAGVGVAWKTGWAVLERVLGSEIAKQEVLNVLDIVALGTVADMVTLIGENRLIVKHGLGKLAETSNIGLQALIKDAGIDGNMDTYKIGFTIGPRLNAVGRMSNADKALKLLEETNEAQARARAALLSAENSSRQNVEKGILDEAEKVINEQTLPEDKVLVIASPAWHEGVIGIVASKLLEKHYLPVICMTIKGEEAKGSARSIAGFNIYEAIKACSENITRFGGHAMAAGLSLDTAKLEDFRRAINAYADNILTPDLMVSKKRVDAEIDLCNVNYELIKDLALLEPFGQGNEKPILMLRDTKIHEERIIGKNREHLKFGIKQKESSMQCLAWGMAEKLIGTKAPLDIIFTPQENIYNGRSSIQALYVDARPIAGASLNVRKSLVLQQLVKNGKTTWVEIEKCVVNDLRRYFPDREMLGRIYKCLLPVLKLNKLCTEEQLQALAKSQYIPWETFYLALVIFYELNLVTIQKNKETVYFSLTQSENKVELEHSPLYRKIKEEYNLLKDIG